LVEYFKLFYKVKKFSAVVHIPHYVRTNLWCFVKVFKNLAVYPGRALSRPRTGETALGVSLVLSLRLRCQRKNRVNFILQI
jgi:hypothetical protein